MDYALTCNIVQAALDKQQTAYARQTAEAWLREQPGHLTMSVFLAQALLAGGGAIDARRVLRQVLQVDPEHRAALALSAQLHEGEGNHELAWAAAAALRQLAPEDRAIQARLARLADRSPVRKGGAWAEEAAFLAAIPALADLERQWRAGEVEQARQQAGELLATHPLLAKAHLILADCLMVLGDELSAVAHIHEAASLDPGGEVARRIWDGNRPYAGAWPQAQVAGTPGPLPHPVSAALGMNLLPQGPDRAQPGNGRARSAARTTQPPEPDPKDAPAVEQAPPPDPSPISPIEETLINIQSEINRLSGRFETRFEQEVKQWVRLKPVYTILTSKSRLQAKYGADGLAQIHGALQALAEAAEARLKLPAGLLYLDDAASLAPFELEPADPADPWAIKTLIQGLDDYLANQEQEIGWLLLVGGPDIIPFHRLPNPTDDGDVEVLSDNPYACRDENYFIPQRAVGRLPDGATDDPTTLLKSISAALAAHHADRRAQKGGLRLWWERLVWILRGRRIASELSFGYSASVWRKASLTVFSKIGSARRLRFSPPLTAAEFSSLALGPARYGYFNLHGIPDGPNWYGQRDPTFPADYPAFPVALRPEDVGTLGCVPEVVFTEACYGALVEGKTSQDALCLKFLASGTQIFAGSTCIAYGGLNSSPEAADLLASFFWGEIAAGRSGGVALQQAKVAFAQHLNQRQNYLDGEEQKTLISFVYYGDPTLTAPPGPYGLPSAKGAKRTWKELAVCPPTVCAKVGDETAIKTVPPDLVEQVRTRVSSYLPGMEQADLAVCRQHRCRGGGCGGQCADCLSQPRDKGLDQPTGKMVFTLRKTAQVGGKDHKQVVKVTVDDAGQMYKLMVSK